MNSLFKPILAAGVLLFSGHALADQPDEPGIARQRAAQAEARANVIRERELLREGLAASEFAVAPRGRIGVTLGQVSEALAAQLGLDANQVILIEGVFPGGAADEAGVKAYDIITRIDGKSPVTQRSLREAVLAAEQGEKLRLTVLRAGEEREIDVPVRVVTAAEVRRREGAGPFHMDPDAPLARRVREQYELQQMRAGAEIEAETLWRRLNEAMRQRGAVEEELQRIELWREGEGGVRMFVPYGRPGTGEQPAAVMWRENLESHQQRMERIEKRLERIEKMLEQLLEASR